MNKIFLIVFAFLLFIKINSINSQTNYIELDSNQLLEHHELKMPIGTISMNMVKFYEVDGSPMVFATYYSNPYIHLYNLDKDSLVHRIYQENLAVMDMEYFNNDSIMVYGYPLFNFDCDSVIRCIDINGVIKHIYPLHHPNLISSKNPPENLISEKSNMNPSQMLLSDNKIFVSFNYGNYGLKGYRKKYPIIGYYDLEKDSLITINDIWFPELKEGVYYKRRFYRPIIALNSKGNILISFAYTPTFYEWNFRTNKLVTHIVTSKFLKPIPSSTVLYENEEEYGDNSYKEGSIGDVSGRRFLTNYLTPEYVNTRYYSLPLGEGRRFQTVYIYYDDNYNYCGESFIKRPSGKESKRGYFSPEMSKGKLIINFLKPTFKPFDEISFMAQMDSVSKADLDKEKNKKKEICDITGGTKDVFLYQKNDIIKYLQKTQMIQDTSFSIVILNKAGCGPCNDHVLNFLMHFQSELFLIKTKPVYLLYANENGKIEDVEAYLGDYMLFDKGHVKMDVSSLYKSFHPFYVMNPRLVLVSNNQVIHDNIYLPNEIETLGDDLLKYQGLYQE